MNDKDITTNINQDDKYGTRQVQRFLLPMLVDIDAFCRANNIEYSLMGGGLLGAIRHRGFVPWDDDLDIIFTRENYEKFLRLAPKKLTNYMLVGSIWVKRITLKDNPHAESEEGCIDLFVFDNVPEGHLKAAFKNFALKTLQGMLKQRIQYQKYTFTQKIMAFGTHCIGQLFTHKFKCRMYDSVSKWGNKKPSKMVNNYVTYYSMISSIKYQADKINEYMDAEFEGKTVRVFKNYDHILTTQFGDYMTPIPEEKRVPSHIDINNAYFKDV